MANTYKPLTLDRIEDLTLGAFGNLPPSETLNHLIRYLSTWSGSEYDILLSPSQMTALTVLLKQQAVHGKESRDVALDLRSPICLIKLIQYGAKVLIPILEARARLQHRAGVR